MLDCEPDLSRARQPRTHPGISLERHITLDDLVTEGDKVCGRLTLLE